MEAVNVIATLARACSLSFFLPANAQLGDLVSISELRVDAFVSNRENQEF